jgi:hypothetical protein
MSGQVDLGKRRGTGREALVAQRAQGVRPRRPHFGDHIACHDVGAERRVARLAGDGTMRPFRGEVGLVGVTLETRPAAAMHGRLGGNLGDAGEPVVTVIAERIGDGEVPHRREDDHSRDQ